MSTHPANRYTQFITPLRGIIALSGFSLPWHTEINFSSTRLGFQYLLVPRATFIAIVFMASVMIVGVSLYMVIRRTLWKSRAPILISSGIGLAMLLAEQLRYTRMTQILDRSIYSIKLGFWGTVAGLVIAVIGILLIRTEAGKGHSKDSVEGKQHWFVVHAGGIIALFCFFMPWEGIATLSGWPGFQLTRREYVVTTAFIASIIIVAGSFYTLATGDLRRLRVVVLVSIGIGLGILLSYYVNFYIQEMNSRGILGKTGTEVTKRSVKFGFWGTVLGYVVAVVGMFLINTKNTEKQVEVPAE